MPKTPVDEAPAGPEMDAAVAGALGYECDCDEEPIDCPIHSDDPDVRFRYSTDIAAAWGLVEKYKHGRVGVGWSEDWGMPYCMLSDAYEYGETVPLAICRTFLKANGVQFVETVEESRKSLDERLKEWCTIEH